jgi:hypothetical protein
MVIDGRNEPLTSAQASLYPEGPQVWYFPVRDHLEHSSQFFEDEILFIPRQFILRIIFFEDSYLYIG